MTPEQLDIVETTARRLATEPRVFADAFYNHLFLASPHGRSLFPDDLTEQKSKLVAEVAFMADAASDLDHFVGRAGALGARHHDYGVRAADYPVVEAALLVGIQAVLGDELTDEVREAWRRLYALISETMVDGATTELYTT